jgi:hypothetical protein
MMTESWILSTSDVVNNQTFSGNSEHHQSTTSNKNTGENNLTNFSTNPFPSTQSSLPNFQTFFQKYAV